MGRASSPSVLRAEILDNTFNKECFVHVVSFPIEALIKQEGMHGFNMIKEEEIILNFGDVEVRKSNIGQFEDGLGVFACRDFKKGEVVVQWNLKILTQEECDKLPEYEKNNFTHKREGVWFFYPVPERYVNRSNAPNVFPDFENQADIALRDIKKDEELSIPDTFVEDY